MISMKSKLAMINLISKLEMEIELVYSQKIWD